MRTLFLALIIFFCSLPVSAQEKTVDKKFIFASSFLAGTTILDVESSFATFDNYGDRRKERNVLLRPLFKSGRPAVYAVEGTLDAGFIAWSYKLKKDGKKMWWVVPVAVGSVHAIAGGFNLQFVF